MHAALVGIGLGAGVGVQIGPMSLFLIRNTLRNGWRVGLAIGAAIALVDGLYGAAGAAGVAPLLDIGPLRLILGLVGAVVLVRLGFRTLWSAFRVRAGGETTAESATARAAFVTALGGTASNPLTVVSWAAVFAAASTAGAAQTTPEAMALVLGVTIGSFGATAGLASLTAVSRRTLGPRAMRVADAVAGVALLGFGGALGWAAAREH